MARVHIQVGESLIEAEWNQTPTARAILEAMPLESKGNYWGSEFYFPIPVKLGPSPDDVEVVEPGTVAYWPAGSCLCLFWGPTPASQADECRAASPVTVVGRVVEWHKLRDLKGRKVRVSLAEGGA